MSLDITLTETSPHQVYSANITHNLTEMAKAGGFYKHLWRPEEVGLRYARDLIPVLRAATMDMDARPHYYRRFDAPNGWGTYDDFRPWLAALLAACIEHPDAELEVNR